MEFINYLNFLHTSIKFTPEYSHSSMNFLDTTIKFNSESELITTLYSKPTHTHLCLHYTSAHHESILPKGPYRLRCICTIDDDFKANAFNLTGYYLKRGYPINSLKKHFQRANQFTQEQLLEVKSTSETLRPVMVTNFSTKNPNVSKLIRDN